MRRTAPIVFALCVTAVTYAAAAEDPVDTRILANTCAGCHGANLEGAGAVPALRGRSEGYIRFNLETFKSGEREGTVMNRLARGYSDAEIASLAAYLSSLE